MYKCVGVLRGGCAQREEKVKQSSAFCGVANTCLMIVQPSSGISLVTKEESQSAEAEAET